MQNNSNAVTISVNFVSGTGHEKTGLYQHPNHPGKNSGGVSKFNNFDTPP